MKISLFRRGGIFCLFLCAVIIGVCSAPALCREGGGPINIEADRMETDQKSNIVVFSGAVEAKQDDLAIQSDQMTVHYAMEKENSSAVSQAISTINATGNVRVSKGNWVANGDSMEYDEGARKAILTGNAKVWQDNNMVTGDRIELYLDEGRSVVDRGSDKGGRVKAFFYPGAAGAAGGQNPK